MGSDVEACARASVPMTSRLSFSAGSITCDLTARSPLIPRSEALRGFWQGMAATKTILICSCEDDDAAPTSLPCNSGCCNSEINTFSHRAGPSSISSAKRRPGIAHRRLHARACAVFG